MTDAALVALALALVRGDRARWPSGAGSEPEARFLELVHEQGLHLLVAASLRSGRLDDCPTTLRDHLEREHQRAAVVESLLARELSRVLHALAEADVPVLLFKGTPLAYTHYPQPWLRPRIDTDILVPEPRRADATRALEALGYVRSPLVDGSLVMRQAEYMRVDAHGVSHAVDVHWRLGNPAIAADLATFEELSVRAVAVADLGAHARALSAVHALVVAAVHHVVHHGERPRLIWRYDVHLIARAMSAGELEACARLAVERRVGRVCASELAAAVDAFATRLALPPSSLDACFAPADPDEPSARYLRPSARRAGRLVTELRATPAWRTRVRLVGQHLFPSPAYMRQAYGPASRARLPLLYAHRILTGVWSWFGRS